MKIFFKNILNGFAIGIAFVIPGFSGGTVAVLLGIYDKLINSITGIFKQFFESIKFIIPILFGMVLAFVAMYFPIKVGLQYFPLPTLCLFVGLMIGGMPQLFDKVKDCGSNGKTLFVVLSLVVAFLVASGIGLLPTDVFSPNITQSMGLTDYLLLFVVCVVASSALIVPGISGSMILMIFGYYAPLMYNVAGNLFVNFGHNMLVLAVAGLGLVVGFFSISFVVKWLLKRHPKGTYFAIIGFVIGSIVTLFYTGFASKLSLGQNEALVIEINALQIILAVMLLLIGFVSSLMMYISSKRNKVSIADSSEK